MHKTRHRQPRHVGNIVVGEVTITAHSQHRADTFQKNRAPLDRHSVRSGHNDFQWGSVRETMRAMMAQRRAASKACQGWRGIARPRVASSTTRANLTRRG